MHREVELRAARALIERASEVLKQRGWCKGTMRDPDGKHCAVGALRAATYGSAYAGNGGHQDPALFTAYAVMLDIIQATPSMNRGILLFPDDNRTPFTCRSVEDFNDYVAINAQHVLHLFRATIWRIDVMLADGITWTHALSKATHSTNDTDLALSGD